MDTIEFLSKATGQVVDLYMESRNRFDRPVSTDEALKAIRSALPACELTDRELVDLIAASAIRRGHDVAFDAA